MGDKVYVAKCAIGQGTFAAVPIAAGETVFTFFGPIINGEQVRAKGTAQANPVQIGRDEFIDVQPPGVFINHSCAPNAGVIKNNVMIALRDIAADEEVRFDYSTTMSEQNSWGIPCLCGHETCRKFILDFRFLPPDRQQYYVSLGVVQSFILKELEEQSRPTRSRRRTSNKPTEPLTPHRVSNPAATTEPARSGHRRRKA